MGFYAYDLAMSDISSEHRVTSLHRSEKKQEFLSLLIEGCTLPEIIDRTGIPKSTIYGWASNKEIKQAYRDAMKGQLSSLLPRIVDRITDKIEDRQTTLLPLVKAAEFVADRVGLQPEQPDPNLGPGLAIQINLGDDNKPTATADQAAEIEVLKAEIARLKANQPVDAIAEEINHG